MASTWGKKQRAIASFAHGSQRIARITELTGQNEFVIEPEPERVAAPVDPVIESSLEGPVTDAEIASLHAGDGEAPIAASPAKRATTAYSQKIPVLGRTITVA
ncbi:MAG TPA: hypothetical protein VGM90_15665 [Kofleriaceae bacterium]|jgi:hypothetical protein